MNKYDCNVEVKRICGNILYYPLNDAATKLTILLKCKTLTKLQLRRIQDCGFEVNVEYRDNGVLAEIPYKLRIDNDEN